MSDGWWLMNETTLKSVKSYIFYGAEFRMILKQLYLTPLNPLSVRSSLRPAKSLLGPKELQKKKPRRGAELPNTL